MSTFTTADLAAIDAAIASGEMRVSVNGRTVEYRSIADLERARSIIQAQLAKDEANAAQITRPMVRHYRFLTLRER